MAAEPTVVKLQQITFMSHSHLEITPYYELIKSFGILKSILLIVSYHTYLVNVSLFVAFSFQPQVFLFAVEIFEYSFSLLFQNLFLILIEIIFVSKINHSDY